MIKKNYKIGLVVVVSVIIMYAFTAMMPSKKSVLKLLDKDKVSCGYYKNNNKISYYLYDGTTIYNTDRSSCIKLKNKNTIDNIIIIDGVKKMDTAIVNSIGDDDTWYGGVNDSKQIDKIKY